MSVHELKQALKDVPGVDGLTLSYATNGDQVLHVGDLLVQVRPMASDDEIRSAILQPLIPTQNVKVTVKPMSTKLQGLAAKIAKLNHDAEFEAGKLDSKLEGATARLPGVFSGAHGAVDGLTKQIDDVEASMNAIQAATNGAPNG